MKIIELKLYSFDELSPEAQEKALKDQGEFEQEALGSWLSDSMKEEVNYLLGKYKMKSDNAKCYYSLGYCQGDGAMIEGRLKWKGYDVAVQHEGHYYHENSKAFTVYTKAGNVASQNVQDAFDLNYRKMCKELAINGYRLIENALENENLKEIIRLNEYTFEADGTMRNT